MVESYVQRAERLLMDLLATPGTSGAEREVMGLIEDRLREAGAPSSAIRFDQTHRRSSCPGQIGNMVLKLPGSMPGGRRLLMAHVDTVPLCQGTQPVQRGKWIVAADRHTGLGADDRAGTAVILAAAIEILENKLPHPPLTFLWTVQEELGLHGARHVRLGLLGKPRLAFNFDGGLVAKMSVGATGGYRMTIHVSGVASHAGASPEKGVSAITIAGLAIAQLQRDGWLGKIMKSSGAGTANIGVIHGGEATNVITPAGRPAS